MASFTATGKVDMANIAALSAILNTGDYFNVTDSSFSVRTGGKASTLVKVGGIFDPAVVPESKISAITVKLPSGAVFKFTELEVEYGDLVDALGVSPASAVELLLAGEDIITGSAKDDVLYGYSGNDVIYGGTGKDKLFGGDGSDWLYGGKGLDRLDGGDGFDRVDYGSAKQKVSVKLAADTFADVRIGGKTVDKVKNIEGVFGGKAGDALTGDKMDNLLNGGGGNDVLKGGAGDDLLFGGDGHDRLVGGKGDDALFGGKGNDVLIGGAGADTYHFDTKLNAKTNVDTIVGFTPGTDKIGLYGKIFGDLSGGGFFAVGTPQTPDEKIIYKPGSGKLLYDADGSGPGKAVLFARLDKGLALSESDFLFEP